MSGPIVVIGDSVLDVDVTGSARRLCPDAPTPVVDWTGEKSRPGGAALAAWLAAEHGDVLLVTALGADNEGAELARLLGGRLEVMALPLRGQTPRKLRIRSSGQTLLRLDTGDGMAGADPVPRQAELAIQAAGTVLVSDYGRGMATHPGIRESIGELPNRTPIVWDPHPRGPEPVPGARLATPNEEEAAQLVPGVADTDAGPITAASRRADALVHRWKAGAVAVTLGSRGALLSVGEGAPLLAPVAQPRSGDTCGAGDQFAATAAAALGDGALPSEAVVAAVRAAATYVEAGGPAVVDVVEDQRAFDRSSHAGRSAVEVAARTRARGGTVVATGGCFDLVHAGHVSLLQAARSLGDCLVVCLNSDKSVRHRKGPGRPIMPAADRVRVLEALGCVDAVLVFDEDTPASVLQVVRPDIWAKGGDYASGDLPEADLLAQWGGQAVRLPYLAGRSTSRIVAQAKRH